MKITVTLREILDAGYWEEFCEKYGWSLYCVNEGCPDTETEEITLKEAKRWDLL